jgi:peptidyl-Lys metalloendopeptidase
VRVVVVVAVGIVGLLGGSGSCVSSTSAPPAEETMFKRAKKSIQADGLVVTLLPGPTPTSVILQVTNPTSTTKTFCDYHTPFEGLRNNIFEVRSDGGVSLDYRGMMAKRAPPRDEDFLDVPAGQSRASGPVDLLEGYALTAGTWQVRFSGNSISGLPASTTLPLSVP